MKALEFLDLAARQVMEAQGRLQDGKREEAVALAGLACAASTLAVLQALGYDLDSLGDEEEARVVSACLLQEALRRGGPFWEVFRQGSAILYLVRAVESGTLPSEAVPYLVEDARSLVLLVSWLTHSLLLFRQGQQEERAPITAEEALKEVETLLRRRSEEAGNEGKP